MFRFMIMFEEGREFAEKRRRLELCGCLNENIALKR